MLEEPKLFFYRSAHRLILSSLSPPTNDNAMSNTSPATEEKLIDRIKTKTIAEIAAFLFHFIKLHNNRRVNNIIVVL